ncbi:hypothetical protein Z969_10410 [Clostridium novyi A str. 4570]|uniref:Uncharacterized protein n=1 Tax=Clostridium novyi A str. 4570 TaxID=1444290 RepID=A0AA89CSF1_CLONO|nr:hypothetical protein [Clostridium novyi]KGM99778.1 hypothetical protein Z969_10410 [Clostridium novyi A str. 4570]
MINVLSYKSEKNYPISYENPVTNQYYKYIYDLVNKRPVVELEKRFEIINDLSQSYFEELEKELPSYLITLLANWCLFEELSNSNPDKVSHTEHPILTVHQIKRRDRKQVIVENEKLDYFNITGGRRIKRNTEEIGENK